MYEKSILIFGAGKIGRSFIGQLFGQSGYEVVFVDIDQKVVDDLNRRKSYPVIIKAQQEETILVKNVRAVSGHDQDAVIKEITEASLMALSVGKNALKNIIPVIAAGLKQRWKQTPDFPLDIIIAENMRSANKFIHAELLSLLPKDYALDQRVGLVETSIGKMVPIMTEEELINDPLLIFAEPYNTLIVDRQGFKGAIPEVKGLSPKENIKAWVDRKAFIHNLGHATAAYAGNFFNPDANYIYEVLADKNVFAITRETMFQAATILLAYYPEDFTFNDLENHIDDLLDRFQNRALKDTVFRVGQDLPRKLSIDDRFAGAIQLAVRKGINYSLIVKAMAYGFFFKKNGEGGVSSPGDEQFREILNEGGVEPVLISLCGFTGKKERVLINEVNTQYWLLKNIKQQQSTKYQKDEVKHS